MLMGETLSGPTIAETWELGLRKFISPDSLFRHDSERGVAFEIPGLTMVIRNADDISVPGRYKYPDLVVEYTDRIFGLQRDQSLIYQRLQRWPLSNGEILDQILLATRKLERSPDTRAASFSLWNPGEDIQADFPVSPVSGCLRVINERLHLQLVARSVDYWVGAVPELIAFAKLLHVIAKDLGRDVGSMTYHIWSAHIYENDCLVHLMR